MDLTKLTRSETIIVGAGTVLVFDLLFVPWHRRRLSVGPVSSTFTARAIEAPNGFWGVMAALAAIAMVAVVVTTRFTTARLPELPVSLGQAMSIAGVAVAGLLTVKLLAKPSPLGVGAYLAIALGGAMAYGGALYRNEAGGAAGPPGGSV